MRLIKDVAGGNGTEGASCPADVPPAATVRSPSQPAGVRAVPMPVCRLSGMPLNSGEVFAGYVIQRLLGAGGMGEVYLAQHPRLPRQDALKILSLASTADSEFRARFIREAELASTLRHPHIVGVLDRGEFNGRLWISMDYVDGADAGRLIRESYSGGMPEQDVSEIVTAVADALDFGHERRLLHRDVKPENILVTASDGRRRRVLLTDFGIARRIDDVSNLTDDNVAVGTISYIAPEQLLGKPLDGRADQYALAATTFHLLTGAPPFQDSNRAVVISQHLGTPPPRISDRRPDLAHLDAVLARALAKDPNERYPSCLDFARALTQQGPRRDAPHPQSGSQTIGPRRGLGSKAVPRRSVSSVWSFMGQHAASSKARSVLKISSRPCRSNWCHMTRSTTCLLPFRWRYTLNSERVSLQTATKSRSVASGTATPSTPTKSSPSQTTLGRKDDRPRPASDRRGRRRRNAEGAGRRHSSHSSVSSCWRRPRSCGSPTDSASGLAPGQSSSQ